MSQSNAERQRKFQARRNKIYRATKAPAGFLRLLAVVGEDIIAVDIKESSPYAMEDALRCLAMELEFRADRLRAARRSQRMGVGLSARLTG